MKPRKQPGDRYRPLLMRARAAEQAALTNLTEAGKRVAAQADKLQQLQTYTHSRTGRPIQNPGALANRHAFIARLNEAIRMQQKSLFKARQEEERARQKWLQANSETRRFGKLIDNERIAARRNADQREQKELDEIAMQRHCQFQHSAGS